MKGMDIAIRYVRKSGTEAETKREEKGMKPRLYTPALLLSVLAMGVATVIFGAEGVTAELTGGYEKTRATLLYEIDPQVDGLLTSATTDNQSSSKQGDYGSQSSSFFQDGRALFTVTTMAKTGYVVPSIFGTAFGKLNDRELTGLSLVSVGGSFFLAYAATGGIPLGYGKAIMMNHGGTLGYLIPYQISTLLHYGTSIDDKYLAGNTYEGDLASEKLRAWSTLFLYPYGMYLGWYAGFVGNDDAGKALVTTYLSQTLGAIGYVAPLYWYDPTVPEQEKDYWMTASGLALALELGGIWAGAQLAQKNDYSAGRGAMLYIAGALGALTGLAAPSFTATEEYLSEKEVERLYLGTTLAGYAAGTGLGLAINPSRDYSFWEAAIIGGSAAGGALIGLGVPYIARMEKENTFRAAALTGAWLGFFAGERISQGVGNQSKAYGQRKMNNPGPVDVTLPGILTLPMMAVNRSSKSQNSTPVPVVNIDVKF